MKDLPIVILLLILLALLLRLDFIFYIAYVVAGIYLWSQVITPRAFRNLRFERRFTDHAFLSERVKVTLVLRNTGRLPLPWLQFGESVPAELSAGKRPSHALSLRGGETARFSYDVRASRRGYYRLGPLTMRAGDLFGWREHSAQSEVGYLTVYPRIIPLSQLGLPSRLPFGTISSQQRLFEDPARPVGVRDYRSGDSMRQINWKVSARHDSLLVRTLQPAISLDSFLLLNLNRDDYDRRTRYSAPEWAIEVVASIAAHLIEQKQAVGLATNGTDPLLEMEGASAFDKMSGRLLAQNTGPAQPAPIPPQSGRPHLMKLLELLARVEPAETVPFAGWTPRACLQLSWGVTIPVITPTSSEELFQALHGLVRAGFNPILMLIAPVPQFGQVQKRARQFGFKAYEVIEKKDLDVWQRVAGW